MVPVSCIHKVRTWTLVLMHSSVDSSRRRCPWLRSWTCRTWIPDLRYHTTMCSHSVRCIRVHFHALTCTLQAPPPSSPQLLPVVLMHESLSSITVWRSCYWARCQGLLQRFDEQIKHLDKELHSHRERFLTDLDEVEVWLGHAYTCCARSLRGRLERGTVGSNWKQMTRVHLLCRKRWWSTYPSQFFVCHKPARTGSKYWIFKSASSGYVRKHDLV